MGTGSAGLAAAFTILPLAVAAAFITAVGWAARRAGEPRATVIRGTAVAGVLTAVWLTATLGLAAAGRLSFTGRPPTMLLLVGTILALALAVGLSRTGARLAATLPLAALVGIHGFRLPLELAMHRAYVEGLMPEQMSYSGLNFDIVTGATALLVMVLLLAGRAGPRLVRAWNWLGLALLVNVVTIALLSAPLPIRTFHNEPANVWVTQPPYVWLPAVLVLAALLGHILLFRRLAVPAARTAARPRTVPGPAALLLPAVLAAALAAPSPVAAQTPPVILGVGAGGTYYCVVTRCDTGTVLAAMVGVEVAPFLLVEAGARRHGCPDCDRFLIGEAGVQLMVPGRVVRPFAGAGIGLASDPEFFGERWGAHGTAGVRVWPWPRWALEASVRGRRVGRGDGTVEVVLGAAHRLGVRRP